MLRLIVSGLDETTCKQVASRLVGAILVAGDRSHVFNLPNECDAVALLRSNPVPAEDAENWLGAGKHLLLVADACGSSEVLERLETAAKSSGSQLMLANPDHFLPSRQLVREQLDAGKFGEVGLVRSHRWEPAAPNGTGDRLRLPTALARDLELACSFVGSEPNLVFATSVAASGHFIQTHLGFPNGAMALVDYCDRLPAGDGYQTLSVIGASGAAYIDDQQNAQMLYTGGEARVIRAGEGVRPLANLLQSFVNGLVTGRDMSAEVNVWRKALLVRDAVRRSLESGQAVAMEEDP